MKFVIGVPPPSCSCFPNKHSFPLLSSAALPTNSLSGVSNEADDDERGVLFLRGSLDVKILRGKDLPDTDRGLFNLIGRDKTDPFVIGTLGAARIFKTRVIDNDLNPEWNETFSVESIQKSRIKIPQQFCR